MEFSLWLIAIGLLLVVIHASSHVVARLPLSPAIVYFLFGMAIGPWGFGWLNLDPDRHQVLIERLCELAVLISLFATGSNLGSTLRGRHWGVPLRLATVGMLVTIAATTAFAYWALDMSAGAALILAAALAPTDPVLAGDVQVSDAHDRDRLRFGLTGEAGLNDGAAFPFVMLGMGLLSLHDLGPAMWRWWAIDLAWAVAGGLAIGAVLGLALGRWVLHRLRTGTNETGPDAFLGLGLVAVAYGLAVTVDAYGFLAVFAAAVALQWTVTESRERGATQNGKVAPMPPPSERALAIESVQQFNSSLESLFEFGVVIMLGVLFTVVPIPWEALVLAIVLFAVIRPAAVVVALQRTRLEGVQRALAAWFGIRGVGSIYYAMYALNHGWTGADADRMLGIVLGVVAASIFLHGISVTPLMTAYERQRARIAARKKRPTRERASH
jgi:NhaP-type Na+/H+ or K+/H+ antiporter